MAVQFGHPSGLRLLEEVRDIFAGDGSIYRRKDRHTIFVCGGEVGENANSLRAGFLTWARNELPDFIPLLAEAAYSESISGEQLEFINLSTFERLIADVCDCVLIFSESVGSYAEIGLFSGNPIRKKILVANEDTYYNRDTFLNLGPIATIDNRSVLRPAISIRRDNLHGGFRDVKDRLENRIKRGSNRRRFQYKPYKDLSFKEKLVAILATITFLRALNFHGLEQSIKMTFSLKKVNRVELRHLLSLLVAAGYVSQSEEYFLVNKNASRPLLDFEEIYLEDLITRVTLYYRQHHPVALERLKSVSNDPR